MVGPNICNFLIDSLIDILDWFASFCGHAHDYSVFLVSYDSAQLVTKVRSRMKISVITDISILRFYGYIGYISADILEKNIGKLKIVKNS